MGSFNFTVTMLIYRIFISANILNSVFSASLDNLGLNDDNEDVALEDLSDFDLHSSDRIQLEKMTRGSDCQYINLVNIKNNQGCTSGSKFVVKPMKHMRKQYLILNGQILLVFVKKSKKFTECQSYQDITSIVECKTVKGLNSIDLQSDSSLDSSVAPSSDLKSNGILLTGGVRVNQTDPLSPETLRSVEVYVPSSNLSYSCPPPARGEVRTCPGENSILRRLSGRISGRILLHIWCRILAEKHQPQTDEYDGHQLPLQCRVCVAGGPGGPGPGTRHGLYAGPVGGGRGQSSDSLQSHSSGHLLLLDHGL